MYQYNQYVNHQITPHFRYSDLACKHCGELIIGYLLTRTMYRLERVREAIEIPLIINSGHRCVVHNREVGGAPRSMHMKFAVDVRTEKPDDLHVLFEALKLMNYDHNLFNGVGWYWGFVHLDLRPHPFTWDNRTAKAVKR